MLAAFLVFLNDAAALFINAENKKKCCRQFTTFQIYITFYKENRTFSSEGRSNKGLALYFLGWN